MRGRTKDFMSFLDSIAKAWAQVMATIGASPELAAVGLAFGVGALAALALLVLANLVKLGMSARRGMLAASVKRTSDVGARVLVCSGAPGRPRAIAGFMRQSIDQYLKDYMFGGPFKVIRYPGWLEGDDAAQRLMSKTDADLVLWAENPRGSKGVARILSRPTNTFEQQRPPVSLAMPKEKKEWTPQLMRATAYAAAKQFRPALGRPQDFRAERLQPVVESLISILNQRPKADPRLLAEMVDDASSGALQLAFAGDDAWIDRSVEIARATLADINRSAAPDRWIAANITLGRALRLKAEKQFDPVMLREGIAHLTEALEALRSEPRFKLAESAAQAIGEAQKLLGTRRKFSISGGGL